MKALLIVFIICWIFVSITNIISSIVYGRFTKAVQKQNDLLWVLHEASSPVLQNLAIVLLRLRNQEDVGRDAVKEGDGLEE